MIHADYALAHQLEYLICAEYRRLCEVGRSVFPGKGVECIEVGGGAALWLGAGSPVNAAVGLGMDDRISESDLQRLETFYHHRGAAALTSVCQMADPTLFELLGRRGWTLTGFEHVLALELDLAVSHPLDMDLEVRVCNEEERQLWARIAARGFADGRAADPPHREFGRIMAARPEPILVLAWVDGEPAGTGSLMIDGGVGWLTGDSTLPQYRGRGVQQAIQRHRLQLAREAGCDLTVTEAVPGSGSQRNMERLGFRIVYTHVEFTKVATSR